MKPYKYQNLRPKAFVFAILSVLLVLLSNIQAQENFSGHNLAVLKKQFEAQLSRGDSEKLLSLADLHFFSGEFQKAVELYQRAFEDNLSFDLQQQRNFSHASRFLQLKSPFDQSTGYFTNNEKLGARITPFAGNSPNEDFAPFLWRDLLFVTSSRETDIFKSRKYATTRLPFLNVHAFDRFGNVRPIDLLPQNLNTRLHDGPIALSADGSLVIITRTYNKPNKNKQQTLYLSYFVKENGKWSAEKPFPYNDVNNTFQHPFYDDKTQTLYYSSDISGGYGGFDLYKSKWDGVNWTHPKNLGDIINSAYDETFPSLAPDGAIAYSSNHVETLGGNDIVLVSNGQRLLLPFPLNSPRDDFSITFVNQTSGYFASNRTYEAFGDNIYFFELFDIIERPFVVRVLDSSNNDPVSQANIQYFSHNPSLEAMGLTNENGELPIYKSSGEPFSVAIEATKEGYYKREIITDDFKLEDNKWVITIYLDPVPVEPAIRRAIQVGYFELFFDNDHPDPNSRKPTTKLTYDQTFRDYMVQESDFISNSANPPGEVISFFRDVEIGMEQLNWLAEFLKREFEFGRHMVIVFTSHASPVGTENYNMILSKRRFASVERFLFNWDGGSLRQYISDGKLDYENTSKGDIETPIGISADPLELSKSVYGLEASRQRKVTVSWRQNPDRATGRARSLQDFRTQDTTTITESKTVYHIIVSSLRSVGAAEEFAANLRSKHGKPATVLPRTNEGFYRVSIQAFETRAEAQVNLGTIKKLVGDNPWVLKID